ncbi:MAG TPA: hypothetical protein VGR78_10335 [Verrucomicrobiae bacterium]|jgi:hypothetical protein|nr:hypothetical protein [Verrucomicrobiae bacterium]
MRIYTKLGWKADTTPQGFFRIPVQAPAPEIAQPVQIKHGKIVHGYGRGRRGNNGGSFRACYLKKAVQACEVLRRRIAA